MLNTTFSALPGHSQLRRLLNLRSLAVAAQLLTLLTVWKLLDIELAWLPMLVIIATLATLNFFSLLRLKSERPVCNLELFAQSGLDVLALSFLLYFAGGSTNPFVSLYLLPLVIAAATLPARYTWGMAALTTACYSLLMVYYIPLPHNPHDMEMSHDMGMAMDRDIAPDSAFNTHVLGMWLGFVISAVVVAYFVVKMAQAVRNRDAQLVQVREEILRNERIVALGTQAAGAAHELGTPLATMAVVIGELQHDTEAHPGKFCQTEFSPAELRDSLSILDEQVRACRRILDKIMLNAQDSGASALKPADELMAGVLDEWQLLRPTAQYHYQTDGVPPAPLLNVDVTLRAALMNLLNNAADASPQGIAISTRWDSANFTLEIHDSGEGLSEEVALKAGSVFFTTKTEGHGLGLFLANATLERLGGTVRLYNRESGGATTKLTLPIARVQT
ncbi:MAG: histidine kinase [Gallionellales bacterium CG_4_9_14_0_8_um_filter_55_61]|nr:MAG: histidine kinase [Gallionellales bacterium CG_4_9_14_0_8_um_filter_55_61]